MSRVLLADDSLHAQRMGEAILREEGIEVVTVSDGATALVRVADVDPDLILADVFLPQTSGYEICRQIKSDSRFRHMRVVLTAGALETLDEDEAREAGADATLRKPFEASAVIDTLKPLLVAAQEARASGGGTDFPAPEQIVPAGESAVPPGATSPVDPERVRAAVTLALDAAMPAMIDEITERVLVALGH